MNVAIYARTSTGLQEKEKTIEQQIQQATEHCMTKNHHVVKVYKDDGWSGAQIDRPALDELRDDAGKNFWDGVVIYDRDRLARKLAIQELVIDELTDKNKDVVFLTEPLAESSEGRIMQQIKGVFADYERIKIAERMRRGKMHKAKAGKIVGHEAPYGYTYIPKSKDQDATYIVNPQEAKIVSLIFDLLAKEHMSVRGIIKRLHEMNILPRDGKEYWASSTLSRLVRREDYIGTAYYNKSVSIMPSKDKPANIYKRIKKSSRKYKAKSEWLPIDIPSIIDLKTFTLAQDQLVVNQAMSPRNIKRNYMLRGLIQCPLCGSLYAGECTRGERYYRSTLRLRVFPLKADCTCRSINANIIELAVWKKIERLLTNPKLIESQYKKRLKKRSIVQSDTSPKIEAIDKKLEHLTQSEKRLVDAYTVGAITMELVKEKLDNIKKQKAMLDVEKKQLTSPTNDRNLHSELDSKKLANKFTKALENRTEDQKAEILHALIENILLQDKQITIRGYIPVTFSSMDELRSINYNRRTS